MNNTHPSCLPLMKILTVSVLVGVLSACTVGPNYRRPDVPISEQFRNAPATHVIADSAWWQAFETQRNRLAVLTGQDPSQFTLPAPPSSALKLPVISGFEQPADLLRRRPDVIAAEQRLIAATADIGSAITDYYPSFSLTGLLGWQATTTAAFGSGSSEAATGLLGLRWRLFDFGRVNAQIQQAKGRQAEALAAWRQTMLLASEEVENALMAIQTTSSALHLRQQAQRELETAWHNNRFAFKQRTIARLPVLEAQDRVLANQQRQTQVLFSQAKAIVWLNRTAAAV